jgi:TolB protein
MDVDGGNVADVVTGSWNSYSGTASITGHAWSPDGTRHVYLSPYHGPAGARSEDLYVVNTDGSGNHAVETGGSEGPNPGWSPDGSRLTYSAQHVVYTLDPDGSDVRGLLWDFSLQVRDYDWSG